MFLQFRNFVPHWLSGSRLIGEYDMPVGYSLYVDAPSTLHQTIDPRTKLGGLVTSFVLALEFNDPKFLGAILAGLLLIGLWARLPFGRLMPFLMAAGWFLISGTAICAAHLQ